MSHYAVHAPIEADDRFVKRYLDAGLDPIEARYASMIEGMDKSLGDLMAYLERKGVADNTIVIFMSDNGGLSATVAAASRTRTTARCRAARARRTRAASASR